MPKKDQSPAASQDSDDWLSLPEPQRLGLTEEQIRQYLTFMVQCPSGPPRGNFFLTTNWHLFLALRDCGHDQIQEEQGWQGTDILLSGWYCNGAYHFRCAPHSQHWDDTQIFQRLIRRVINEWFYERERREKNRPPTNPV